MDTNTPEVKKPFYKRKWFWIGAIVLLIVIGASGEPKEKSNNVADTSTNTTDNAKSAEATEVAVEVKATKLIADYKANEISADATYKDKLVKVTGVVGSIAKDVLDNPYVTLTNETQYSFESVQCYFSKADEAKLTAVTKDTRIIVQGRVSGKSLTNVMVKECSLVQ
jgi:predicted nucleic acid-binding protein